MKRFKNILCVFESLGASEKALERAVTLAESNQASLTVVDVVEQVTTSEGLPADASASIELQSALISEHEQVLHDLVAPYQKRINIKTKVLTGILFLQVIREVLIENYDLVVKVPETLEWYERLFGSDDMHLLRKCPCPVWLIKSSAPKSFRHVLAAVDLDDGYSPEELEIRAKMNRQIMEMASSLAIGEFAQLHVANVWNAPGEGTMRGGFINMPEEKVGHYVSTIRRQRESMLNSLMDEVVARQGEDALKYLNPETHLVKGSARKEIPSLAKQLEADLIVMGTVARTGVPGFFMGNTAETILNQIDCSVLAIKPPGFVTPVTIEE